MDTRKEEQHKTWNKLNNHKYLMFQSYKTRYTVWHVLLIHP